MLKIQRNKLQFILNVVIPVLILCLQVDQCKGQVVDTFGISYKVIPTESRRRGLNQTYPCPQDSVMFTCVSQTSANQVSWMSDIRDLEDLAIFTRTDSIGFTLMNFPNADINATLRNNSFPVFDFTLTINLNNSGVIVNGTGISCGEIDRRMDRSSIIPMNIIGLASAPTVTIMPRGLTAITLHMTVPSNGEICVDNYAVTLSEGAGGRTLFGEIVVIDATQKIYTFDFSGFDLCRETPPAYTVTAVAMTNGAEGMKTNRSVPLDVDKTNVITSALSATQMFTTEGTTVTLYWEVIDENIENGFVVECHTMEQNGIQTPVNCTHDRTSVTQLSILLPYSDDLLGKGITFTVRYQYLSCLDAGELNFEVQNVNSSLPVELQDRRAVNVAFNEALFDKNTVKIMFSSNCTVSTVVDYMNPVTIAIPDTGTNTGECQFAILLVDNSQQPIGYPIRGTFEAFEDPNSTIIVTSVVVTVLMVLIIIIVIIICVVVAIIVRKKSKQQQQDTEVPTDLQSNLAYEPAHLYEEMDEDVYDN